MERMESKTERIEKLLQLLQEHVREKELEEESKSYEGKICTVIHREGKEAVLGRIIYCGREYLRIIPVRDNGQEAEYGVRIRKDQYYIYEGARKDLLDQVYNYQKAVRTWETSREIAIKRIQEQAKMWILEQIKKWDEENPKPVFNINLSEVR